MIDQGNTAQSGCPFCAIPTERVVIENALPYAIRDGYPVTHCHSLVIPKRHVIDYFGLTEAELLACDHLVKQLRLEVMASDPTVSAFNVGTNAGAAAGQTIFHFHIHVISRRDGDMPDPRGGVRHVIPGMGYYQPK